MFDPFIISFNYGNIQKFEKKKNAPLSVLFFCFFLNFYYKLYLLYMV